MPGTGSARLDALLLIDPELRYAVERRIRYGQTRALEVTLACAMMLFGVILLVPVPTFVSPGYRVVAHYVTEGQAGTVALLVGSVRLLALWINGRRSITPVPRLLGCTLGFFFWSALAVGFALAIPPLSTGLAVYPVLAMAELYSSSRAGGDTFVSDSLGLRRWFRVRRERAGATVTKEARGVA